MWLQTQWVNLSLQAKQQGLPKLPYFDPDTYILSKSVNEKLWEQLVRGMTPAQGNSESNP